MTTRRRRSEGQAAVELALALPIVFVVILAVVHVGLVVRDQVLVTHAAREAARAAAVGADADAAARSSAGLDSSRMTVMATRRGDQVVAVVSYQSSSVVPFMARIIRPRVITAQATMRVELPP